ncbi:MAG: formyltransferase family protein [Ferruginibacter sp.]|nr:formyltransferase family protein [Ferruginibacter sp.]
MAKRIYLLGAGEFVLRLLQWIGQQGWEGIAITNPDQSKKTLQSTGLSFVESLALLEISCVIVDKPEDIQLIVSQDGTDNHYLSYGAPWKITSEVLAKTFQDRLLNIHGTRLPRERGGTIFSWIILTGQKSGMCLVHKMTNQIDEGPIVSWEEFIYPPSCKIPADYIQFYETKMFQFLKELLEVGNTSEPYTLQPSYLSSYWPRLKADVHGWLNFDGTALELERLVNAFDKPYGGARCRWNNKVVILRDTYSQAADGYSHPFQHGIVYRNNGKWLSVAVKEGELLVCDIKDEKGNDLMAEIKIGDRLYSLPGDKIATLQRVVKTKAGLITKSINF